MSFFFHNDKYAARFKFLLNFDVLTIVLISYAGRILASLALHANAKAKNRAPSSKSPPAKMYLNYSSSRKNCLVNRNKCYVSYLIRKVDVDCLSSKIANIPKIRPESYRLHIVPHFGCDRLRILINLNITLWPMPGGISCAISEWLTVVVYLFYLTFKYLFLDMQTHVSTQQMNGNRRTLTTSISGPAYRIFSLADERREKGVGGRRGWRWLIPTTTI